MNALRPIVAATMPAVALLILTACSSYTLQAGDFDKLKYSEKDSKELQLREPAYPAIYPGYAYVTIQSNIQPSSSTSSLFNVLGCGRSPIVLSSRQQSFSLVSEQQMITKFGAAPTSVKIPVFSFSRSDVEHTCNLSNRTTTLGPLSLAKDSYQIDGTIRSSTADSLNSAELATVAESFINAVPLNPAQPIVGSASQIGIATALNSVDSYVSKNLTEHYQNVTTLADISADDIRKGSLAYATSLYIEKSSPFNDEKIPVGNLVFSVRVRLSLFTANVVQIQTTDSGSPAKTTGGLNLQYAPDFAGYLDHVWNGWVTPLNSDAPEPLSKAIDDIPGVTESSRVVHKLDDLTDASSPTDIREVCTTLRERATQLMFDEEDTLAIIATALASTKPWKSGAANMNTASHGCFSSKGEIALMNTMHVPTGNEPEE